MMDGFTMMKSIDKERDRFEDEPIARTKIVCPYCGEKITLWRYCTGWNSPDKYFTMCENSKCKARFYFNDGYNGLRWTFGRWVILIRRRFEKVRFLTENAFLEETRNNIENQKSERLFAYFWDSQEDALLFLDKKKEALRKK